MGPAQSPWESQAELSSMQKTSISQFSSEVLMDSVPTDSSGVDSAACASLRYPLQSSFDEGTFRCVGGAVTAIRNHV